MAVDAQVKRYKCTVSYVGMHYEGWQSQRKGTSIQEHLEAALESITHRRTITVASGRTDAGVSARGQVFMFESDMDLSARKWMGAINGRLPKDIHVMAVEEVSRIFHARYCVRKKTYAYRINTGPYDVFTKDCVYQCPYPLDFEKMKEAAKDLVGTHDFSSFNTNSREETPDQVRTIFSVDLSKEGDVITISYTGKGFLRYMVRMMSAQLMEVGRGKEEPSVIRSLLEHPSKLKSRRNARPEGLTLETVDYFELIALNGEGMIREYLYGDILPEDMTLKQIEAQVKEKSVPRRYAFTTRSSQELMGELVISDDCVLTVNRKEDLAKAESLREGILQWMAENEPEKQLMIKSR